jgi:hypothetical protein
MWEGEDVGMGVDGEEDHNTVQSRSSCDEAQRDATPATKS